MIVKIFQEKQTISLLRCLATAAKAAEMVTLTIDGNSVTVPKGTMLVEAIKKAGSTVPTMCYHPDLPTSGGICRVCLVESTQRPGVPIISCRTPVAEGMQILTHGQKIREFRQANMAMMLADHPSTCLSCPANTRCKTQRMAACTSVGQCGLARAVPPKNTGVKDQSSVIYRDADRCINCDICVQTCKAQGVGALAFYNRDGHSVCSMGPLGSSECIQCGQCVNRCPTGALMEMPEIVPVFEALKDPTKIVVFQMAPSIRVAIAEEFGAKPGEKVLKNEVVTALKQLGKNVVVMDTDFSADLTIIEEGHELIERLYRTVTGKRLLGDEHMPQELPMFTSCCPGWVTFVEKNYPDMIKNMSTAKSPMQMLSSLIKGYWAKEIKKIDPRNIVNVAIMPCTAKKQEKDRPDMLTDEGAKVTDYVLTTRELGTMLHQSNIDPTRLPPTKFDKVMGESTGAGVIFGATGGVMEAALRTAYEVLTGRPVPFKNLNIEPVRGMDGIREASIKLENLLPKYRAFEGFTLKIAVAHGIQNARQLVEVVRQAKLAGRPAPWHFIEIMACSGGCIGGGGQPKPTNMEIRKARTRLIFQEDANLPRRKSHENPEITEIYKNYLKEPLGHMSHHYLHRGYLPDQVRDLSGYNPAEAAGLDDLLSKYPKEQQYLLPIVIEECDKKGYISDPSLIKIARHLKMYPTQVEAILSSYHYFPRKHTSDTHIYLCRCHNCMMRGQDRVIRAIEEKYGISDCHGGVSKDGKFTFHTLNWLGWCVNDGPAMMIKRMGTDYIETLSGLNERNIETQINSGFAGAKRWPEQRIVEKTVKRLGNFHSFIEDRVDLKESVGRAVKMGSDSILKEVYDSGLVGRGGAGFRTGTKWKSARDAAGPEKFVVCNADEGLPSTYKDWFILLDPARRREVIAGMGICAKAIGAKKCYMYLRYEYRNLLPGLLENISEVKHTCPELADLGFEVRLGGGPYVAGEENAQFESIQGAAPLPRKDRPASVFPTVQGLFYKPTVINNVETFWSVPHIIGLGAKSFAPRGLTKLLSVTGDVPKPVLIETLLDHYTLRDLIDEIGVQDVAAAEVGGCTEPLVFPDKFGMKLGFGRDVLSAVGSVVLFNSSRDLVQIYANKLNFMAEESCKQCVPCRDGSKIFLQGFEELRCGRTSFSEKWLRVAAESAGATSICAHGRALPALVNAALEYVKAHPEGKPGSGSKR